MINCVTIDYEPLALRQMESYIEKTPFLSLGGAFNSALDALAFLQNNVVDLLFVDINMPDLNGMELVKSLIVKPAIIFTTAYSEYAVEGFKVDAVDYLVKPIAYPDFLKASERARQRIQQSEPAELHDDHIFVKSEYKVLRVNYNDIAYIEGMREYVKIHLTDQSHVLSLMSIKKLEEKLPSTRFMRVHRSFIVNLEKITTIERNRIVFPPDVYIPVSEQYKDVFQQFVAKHFLR